MFNDKFLRCSSTKGRPETEVESVRGSHGVGAMSVPQQPNPLLRQNK